MIIFDKNVLKGANLMKQRTKITLIMMGILAVTLAVWLLFSGNIIRTLSKDVLAEEVQFDWATSEDEALGSIDDIISFKGIFQKASIRGWVFVETAMDNSSRTISLVLKNELRCYEIPLCFDSLSREDVLDAFPSRNIFSKEVGFYATFPTYNIKEGIYDAYLYCRENEHSYGLANSHKQIVKDKTNFSLRKWQSAKATPIKSFAEMESVKSSLDIIDIDSGTFSFSGWAYQPELDCAEQSVYFSINGAAYTTQPNARPDVAEVFENENYTMSGYRALISMEDIPEGESEIRLLVENGGELYSSTSITVIRNGDNIQKKA